MNKVIKAVHIVRSLGGDTVEEFEAFRQAKRERAMQLATLHTYLPDDDQFDIFFRLMVEE